jgi:hypothetical protein
MIALLALLLAAWQAPAGRSALGIYQGWGAFREAAPAHCFAIAQPIDRTLRRDAFVSIASWPGRGLRNQLHVRLSRARSQGARVVLTAGERRFTLLAGPRDAWAPDARTDAVIVAAMRGGRALSVESVGANGAPFADSYALEGAASAIDAAALACLR